jgi:hypothetical protein
MEVIDRNPHYICKNYGGKYVLIDGVWAFEYYGDISHFRETIIEAFDKDGNYISKIPIKRELISKYNEKLYSYTRENIVQINYDFYLLPQAGGGTMDDIEQLRQNMISSDFAGNFDIGIISHGYDRDVKEICKIGHSRFIYNSNPEKISLDQYCKNYELALKKYPIYELLIEEIFNRNKKLIKRITK